MNSEPILRPAAECDITGIRQLLKAYAEAGVLLDRDEDDIRFYLKNFTVAVTGDGKLLGCMAVRDFGGDLLEVRSLAVQRDLHRCGIGRKLVQSAVARLTAERKSFRLFALTLRPDFFTGIGFEIVSKEEFPEKIWHDCSKCPKKDRCDEIAVAIRVGQQ